MWHFYAGYPLNVYMIDDEGNLGIIRLGNNHYKGEVFQAVVPAGVGLVLNLLKLIVILW
jgi:predicted cupin superfamily sugar epimerase